MAFANWPWDDWLGKRILWASFYLDKHYKITMPERLQCCLYKNIAFGICSRRLVNFYTSLGGWGMWGGGSVWRSFWVYYKIKCPSLPALSFLPLLSGLSLLLYIVLSLNRLHVHTYTCINRTTSSPSPHTPHPPRMCKSWPAFYYKLKKGYFLYITWSLACTSHLTTCR